MKKPFQAPVQAPKQLIRPQHRKLRTAATSAQLQGMHKMTAAAGGHPGTAASAGQLLANRGQNMSHEETMTLGEHKPGSRKSQGHAVFAREGAERALTVGRELDLKDRTIASWIGEWRRANGQK
jgi:hypothetical protein